MKLPAAVRHARFAVLMGAVIISACTVTSVVMDRMNDRAWLYDLAKHPTQTKWDRHIDQVLYLVSVGDRQALSAARVLMPSVFRERAAYPQSDRLAAEMYAVAKLNGIEKLPVDQQIAWIRYYDQNPPTAWWDVRTSYKREHAESFSMIGEPPEVAAATEPATPIAALVAAATQPTTTPIAVATQPSQETLQAVVQTAVHQATTQSADAGARKADAPRTPIAISKPIISAATQAVVKKAAPPAVPTNSLQRVPAQSLQKRPVQIPASTEEKPAPPESTF